jgi:flagellar FliL protein
MVLIMVVAILVLGLSGGGAWFYLSKKNAPHDDEEVAHVAPKGPPTYLPLENMVVNLADLGGEKVAQVGVTLELADAKAPDKVKVYMPAIRSGILMLLSQRTSEELLLREGKEKLAADILVEAASHFSLEGHTGKVIKTKSSSQGKHVADDNPVRGVLFSSFIVQ